MPNMLSSYFLCCTDTLSLLVLLITSSSGCSQMATSSRTCRATTPLSTLSLLTLMAFWCLEVLITGHTVTFSLNCLLRPQKMFVLENTLSKNLCSPCSRQWNHPHVGLENRLQLPADSCSCAAWISGQRVGHLRLHVRQLGKQTDHRRG